MEHSRYFGLHFDFHAGNVFEIGQHTRPEDIAWYIEQTHPDFVQCDCKGHPGNSCYPTKVGKPADKLMADNLRVWVDTVHSYGLPVYVHYSGVMDAAYVAAYPESAAVHEDGTLDASCVSVFSDYVDRLMIPQLKELIDEYGIDGVWVDGDNWAVYRDYSVSARPYLTDGMSYAEHNRVMRDGFMKFIRRYVDELHRYAPAFRIGSNWLYTSQVPESPDVDVDYISGDFDPENSAHRIRFETRCVARQGKPWDLMTWTFGTQYNSHGTVDKSAPQLMQEAAMVIAHGGGFQLYKIQNRDGSAKRTRSDVYRRVAEFMHPRRLLYGKQPVAQVGIVYSAQSRYAQTAEDPCIYNPPHVSDAIKGLTHAVLDGGYTTNVVLEHQLDTLSEYEVVIVPEWKQMPNDTERALISYAQRGGNLVVVGADACARFGMLLGKSFGEIKRKDSRSVVGENDRIMTMRTDTVDLVNGNAGLYSFGDPYQSPYIPLYRTDAEGQGTVTFIACDFGTFYDFRKSYVGAGVLHDILGELSAPWITADQHNVDIVLQRDGDALLLNVINLNQSRHSVEYTVFEEVPPVNDVVLTVRFPIETVELPLGEEYTVTQNGDTTEICLKRLDIHTVIRMQLK